MSATLTTPGGSYSWTPATLARTGPLSVQNNTLCPPTGSFLCDRYQGAVQTVSINANNGTGDVATFVGRFIFQDDDAAVFDDDAIPLSLSVAPFEAAFFDASIQRTGPDAVFAGPITSIVRIP